MGSGKWEVGSDHVASLGGDGEGADERDLGTGALGGQVKAPDGADVVAPPLETCWLGHAEAVEVHDATAEAVLGHLGYRGDLFVSHRFELLREGARRHDIAGAEVEPQRLQVGRHAGALETGAGGRHQQPKAAGEQRFDGFNALAGDLEVWFLLAQRLALGIERDAAIEEQLQVTQPLLGIGWRRRYDDEGALGTLATQPGDEGGAA